MRVTALKMKRRMPHFEVSRLDCINPQEMGKQQPGAAFYGSHCEPRFRQRENIMRYIQLLNKYMHCAPRLITRIWYPYKNCRQTCPTILVCCSPWTRLCVECMFELNLWCAGMTTQIGQGTSNSNQTDRSAQYSSIIVHLM